MNSTRIVAIIPAHLDSIRFPGKILYPFFDLPMVEHVRRRALLCDAISEVYVATCDKEIEDQVILHGGTVIPTSNKHTNGTTRVAEAASEIDCSHVLLLQGDEPLLLPQYLDLITGHMIDEPDVDAWNVTGNISEPDELDRHSFVKCAVGEDGRILYCFRRSPGYGDISEQKKYIRKILGIIAYRKPVLIELADRRASRIEVAEFIEQMRIIEAGYFFRSIPVDYSTPSVNEPGDASIIMDTIRSDPQQAALLEKVLRYTPGDPS